LSLLISLSASAHEGLQHQLAQADERIAAEPTSADALLARARLFQHGQLYGFALRDLDAADALQPGLRPVAFVRAQVHRDQGDWARAESVWLIWSQGGKPTIPGFKLLADVYEATARPDAALNALDEAVALGAGPDTALRRARLAASLNLMDRACSGLLADADRLGAVVLRLELYRLELSRGRADAAIAQASSLLATMPNNPDWLLLRAQAHRAAGHHQQADQDLERALAQLTDQIAVRPTPQRLAAREAISQAMERSP